jgi:nitrogen-specific signal transduction histidine kinase
MSYPAKQAVSPADTSTRILDTLNSTILCLDAERRIRYVNAAAEALFDMSSNSLINRPFASLLSQLEPSSILA